MCVHTMYSSTVQSVCKTIGNYGQYAQRCNINRPLLDSSKSSLSFSLCIRIDADVTHTKEILLEASSRHEWSWLHGFKNVVPIVAPSEDQSNHASGLRETVNKYILH